MRRANVSVGGVYRCCLSQLPTDDAGYAVEPGEGDERVECGCGGGMTFQNGRWEATWIVERNEALR
jgi:hypothetical protein